MTMTEEYSPAKLRLVCRAMCALSLVLLFFVRAGDVLGQQAIKRPVGRAEKPSTVFNKTPTDIPQRPFQSGKTSPPTIDEIPPGPITMEFSLDWTTCQVHRVDGMSPIKIILPGEITCTTGVVWMLANSSNRPPALYFVEDIFGRRQGPDSDIALTCEISLDGGPFQPMIIPPQNVLGTVFPPGTHTFQVRITGQLDSYQQPGYYRLQLAQNLTPQL